MNFLGHNTSWSDYDMQLQLRRWRSQGLWNKGFNLGDAFSKSLSIDTNVRMIEFEHQLDNWKWIQPFLSVGIS